MPSFDIDINFNLDTSGIEEAEEMLGNLRDTADEMSESVESTDSSGIEEIGDSASQTSENLKQASEEMGQLGNETDETNQKMQETANSSASIGTALVGVAGAMGLDAMIQKADNVNTSWNRLSLTFDGTGVSMDTLKAKTKQLQESTGKSGSSIRDYFNQMGIAGITNVDLLTTSFNNMSGRAYQTGSSVEQMEGALQRMVMSGNAGAKMLSNLGISNTEMANAMGVSATEVASAFKELTETERLEILNKAMGDGTKANEMYKNSYAGLKEQSDIAFGGLMVAIGQSILPVVIPAVQTLGNTIRSLTNVWKGLPSPITSVFGALAGGVVGVTALAGALGTLGYIGSSVVGGLKSLKSGFDTLRGAMQTAKLMTEALRNAESISQGVRSALALATGTATTVEEANAVAKSSSILPTQLLAIAENSLLLPILLVVGAIIGLIAVLWWLYNNNEQVRNGINNLIQQFQQFMMKLEVVKNIIIMFVQVAIQKFMEWVNNGGQSATNLVNAIYNTLTTLPSKVSSAISGITDILTKPFEDAWNTIKPLVDAIGDGVDTLNSVNPFGEFEGFSGSVGYEGFTGALNGTIANGSSNSSSVTNNFNINGIIEESASEYIVGAVNNHIKKQNLVRGV